MRHWRAEAALLFNTLIWGVTFVLVKNALTDVSPYLFLALRFSLATLVLLAYFYLIRPVAPTPFRPAAILPGIFLFAGYAFQTIGLQYTTPSKSAFITGLTIPLVPFLNSLVYRCKPKFGELAGVIAATAGIGLLTMPAEHFRIATGDLITLGCAFAFAAHILILGRISGQVGHDVLSIVQVAVPALLSGAMLGSVEIPRMVRSPTVIAAIVICGVLATALPFTIQAWAQRHTTPTRTALIFACEPLFAWATSWLLTGEVLAGRAAAGALLILAGILLLELKPFTVQQNQP